MPTTINGIGTHYYGKANLSTRSAVCQSCGRAGDLQSYDTRLWFVVVFIPVIPLGRKRIIDQCPACHRHYVADKAEFEQAQNEALAESLQDYLANPSADGAIAVHGKMLGYGAHGDARAFREQVLPRYRDDAQLHAAMASHLDETNQLSAAAPLYERAYQLDQSLPVARDGLARHRITEGRLDEARTLVGHLEQPGASERYPMGTLYVLAEAYEKAGRHDEALELCQTLLRELPGLQKNRDFRKLVRQSEKGSHAAEGLVSTGNSWLAIFNPGNLDYSTGQRLAAYAAVLAVLAAGGLAILNEYYRQHRTVVVRNEFGPAAQVTIDGHTTVPPGKQQKLTLSEGTHHVSITGLLNEDFDMDMHTGYWSRWTNSPAWVVNVGGLAQLVHYKIYYAEHPRPTDSEFFGGQSVYFAPHIDYLFSPSPESLPLSSKTQEVTKHELGVVNEAPNDVFQYLLANSSPEDALHYVESALLLFSEDNDLLASYYGTVLEAGQEARAKSLLKSQLDRRPVLVNWHRFYQELHKSEAERNELLAYYDGLLAKEPRSAVLLYLRGRLTPTNREAETYFQRSKDADPKFSWPWAAEGYVAYTRGDWHKCKECFQEAARRGHEDNMESYLLTARLGLGEGEAAEREYRRKMDGLPPNDSLATALLLTTALTAKGDAAGARKVIDQWAAQVPEDKRPTEFLEEYRGLLDFTGGDMVAVQRRVQAGTASPSLKLYWLLSTGRPAQAASATELAPILSEPWKSLALSVAFSLAGNEADADTWRDKAIDALSQTGLDEGRAANLLRAKVPPTKDQLDEVGIPPSEKSLLVAALAVRFPQEFQRYAEMAEKLSVQPSGFAPLVKKVVALGEQAVPAAGG